MKKLVKQINITGERNYCIREIEIANCIIDYNCDFHSSGWKTFSQAFIWHNKSHIYVSKVEMDTSFFWEKLSIDKVSWVSYYQLDWSV